MGGAAVHEGHAQQPRRRLAVLLVVVHLVLPQAADQQAGAAGLIDHLVGVQSGERLGGREGTKITVLARCSILS